MECTTPKINSDLNSVLWVIMLCQYGFLKKEMTIHSSILAWRIPMDRGAWQATVHWATKVGHGLATKPPPPVWIYQF